MRQYLWIVIGIVLGSCGTLATPVWQPSGVPTSISVVTLPTILPTAIPATSTIQSTEVPPTETPTRQLTIEISPTRVSRSPLDRLVELRDAENGEILFNTFQPEAGFACSTCHDPASENRLIGPGLLNVAVRAQTRVNGQSAVEYIYNSIINSNDYIVDGFPEGLMPENWEEVYSGTEILDIVAYLVTLEGESIDVTDKAETQNPQQVEIPELIQLPETADADQGAELFQTFQPEAGFACSTCHRNDSEDRLIGPGLLNIGTRAQTRVDGQTDIEYLFISITNPGNFVVPDFPDTLMPKNWSEIYSEAEIYDIIAYLLTLVG